MKINKVVFEKKPEGLFPLDQNDKDNFAKITNGELFEREFKKVRNPKFHRLVFKFVNLVFEYQNEFDYFENFRDRLTFLSGYYKEYILVDEPGRYIAKIELGSWSFSNMDDIEFKELFKRVKDVCWRNWITKIEDQTQAEKIYRELIRFD